MYLAIVAMGERLCEMYGFRFGEVLFDVVHKRRAAGACQESFFGKFLRFGLCDHIRAESRFDYGVESELLQAGYDLTELGIGELAGNGGRDDGINLVFRVVVALFEHVYSVEDERFVRNRAERALIYARAAGNALVVVDSSALLLVTHGDGLDLAGILAGTLVAVLSRCRGIP